MTAELALPLVLAFAGGGVLGAIYLVVLWRGVRRLAEPGRSAAFLLGGGALRVALVAGGFFLVSDGDWRRLLACTAGFILVRTVAIRRVRAGAATAEQEA